MFAQQYCTLNTLTLNGSIPTAFHWLCTSNLHNDNEDYFNLTEITTSFVFITSQPLAFYSKDIQIRLIAVPKSPIVFVP